MKTIAPVWPQKSNRAASTRSHTQAPAKTAHVASTIGIENPELELGRDHSTRAPAPRLDHFSMTKSARPMKIMSWAVPTWLNFTPASETRTPSAKPPIAVTRSDLRPPISDATTASRKYSRNVEVWKGCSDAASTPASAPIPADIIQLIAPLRFLDAPRI